MTWLELMAFTIPTLDIGSGAKLRLANMKRLILQSGITLTIDVFLSVLPNTLEHLDVSSNTCTEVTIEGTFIVGLCG